MDKTVKPVAWGNYQEGYAGVLIEVTERVLSQCGHRHREPGEARECVRYNGLETGLPPAKAAKPTKPR